ncbi:fructuronate reductase [Neorhizobium huautlense]|uniref:Fructuronate reductase n=1 Tax=Neorhizobium huautlense TaxID=67774 RepID=A0ABT9PZ99_9HYPH|nr:mannitol dehydrogenase family protein [Neorhizobium huautlense]MDP9839816.1 fructuronate reductase [Neorhizobium huautlense]
MWHIVINHCAWEYVMENSPRMRLSNASAARLGAFVDRPAFDRREVSPGIVHIGLGAFCRAHLAVYTEDVIAKGASDWGIVGVDTISTAVRDALKPQDCLYTLLSRDNGDDSLRVVGSIIDVMISSDQRREIFELMCTPEIRIVTLTVTEKGYCQDAATGLLDEQHPAVIADLANPTEPNSIPGFLTEALRLRKQAGHPPFTVLVCDNLAQNGTKVHRLVSRFAELRDADLGQFIRDNVSFPCTMVDRITPATQDADRETVAGRLGVQDAWPVVTEPFRQWVIEDQFPLGRPDWEKAGAIMVDDVLPFEMMKLRCLNGAHSTLAYLAVVAGIDTISDAMTDASLPKIIRQLWDNDLIPSLAAVPGTDVKTYTHELEARFQNTGVRHLTLQISSDGSQKLPPRLLEAARELYAAGTEPKVIPLTVAAWMRFLSGKSESGMAYTISDPHADKLTAIFANAENDPERLADSLFTVRDIFGDDLPTNQHFRSSVIGHLRSLITYGTAKTLKDFLANS